MCRLRHVPANDVDQPCAAAQDRQRHGIDLRSAPGLLALAIQAEREHLGAGHRRHERGVGMQADEQLGLAVVGQRRTLVEPDPAVLVAGQDDADAEPRLDQRSHAPADIERHLLFEGAARTLDAVVVAAVTGVDDNRLQDSPRRGKGRQRVR